MFGRLTQLTGQNRFEMEDVLDMDELCDRLLEQYPGLQQFNYQVAVDKVIVQGNMPLIDGMTVALMPPFSGG